MVDEEIIEQKVDILHNLNYPEGMDSEAQKNLLNGTRGTVFLPEKRESG